MTSQPIEPVVDLRADTESIRRAREWQELTQTDPTNAIEQATTAYRIAAVNEARREIAKAPSKYTTATTVRALMNVIWLKFVPNFRDLLAPMVAAEMYMAMRSVRMGTANPRMINAMASQYAEQMGEYYHRTSTEAMIQGFNSYLNRRVPVRMALEKVLDAYGLTPRQMSGLTAMQVEAVKASNESNLVGRVKQYIGKSLRQRMDIFAEQEMHNMRAQAAQVSWLYAQEHGALSERAEKVWLTAKDERVCPVCGPLHGQAIPIHERFTTETGEKFWVPGAHTNCRCEIRVRDPLAHLEQVGKAYAWDESKYRRDAEGKFAEKPDVLTAEKPSAFLESTIARAEQVRREPQKVQQGKLVQQPRISQTKKVTQRPKIQQQKVTQEPQGKIVQGTQAKISQQSRERIAQHTQGNARIKQAIVAAKQSQQAPAKKSLGLKYKPTIKLEKKVYALAMPYEVSGDGHLQLTPETTFSSDLTGAEYVAQEILNQNIEDQIEVMKNEGGHYVEVSEDSPLGQKIGAQSGYLDDEALADMVAAVAMKGNHNALEEEQFWAQMEVPIEWEDGSRTTANAYKLGTYFGLSPEQFHPVILEMEEGWYDERSGQTTQQDFESSRHGHDSFTTQGLYRSEEVRPGLLHIEPDVEEEWINKPE